jgi:acetolactate synthase I/II/III large subunit
MSAGREFLQEILGRSGYDEQIKKASRGAHIGMNGADILIRCLEKEQVEYVFGYPGVAIAPFYDSILNTEIKTILVRQEQNAAHAASGYTRLTGRTGVVAVTSGPGAENLITGIATAFADSIPMICITGQVDSSQVGGDVFQEADISGAVESFVKYSYIVRKAEEIPRIVKEAFYIAGTGRPGPVLIDLPCDIQQQTVRHFEYPKTISMRTYKPTVEGHAVQIKKVMHELTRAKKPILCVGGGVHLSHAQEEVCAFARSFGIPAVCTMMGLGVFATEDPMFYGMVGNNGQKFGNKAMNEADLILMVGARVADRSISQPDLITENKILVHIDVDPAEIGKNAGASIPLVGDIRHIFGKFLEKKEGEEESQGDRYAPWRRVLDEWRDEAKQEWRVLHTGEDVKGAVDPAYFLHVLSLAMDEDGVFIADVGQNQLWSCANAVIRRGRFFTSGGMGTMGYAVPAAMGAQLADEKRQVVAVCGDGGFQMTMMELATMKQYGIRAKVVVLKNGALGLVRQYQHLQLQDRFSVVDLGDYPHLEELTKAYDMHFLRVCSMSQAKDSIEQFLSDPESVLMEVDVNPNVLA